MFMHRMAEAVEVSTQQSILDEDQADTAGAARTPYTGDPASVVVYRIAGPFFFGAASAVAQTLARIGRTPRAFVLDLTAVPIADATAAHEMQSFIEGARRSGARVAIAGANSNVLRVLLQNGVNRHSARFFRDPEAARGWAEHATSGPVADDAPSGGR